VTFLGRIDGRNAAAMQMTDDGRTGWVER